MTLIIESLEAIKDNLYLDKQDIPYLLLILTQELRYLRELEETKVYGIEEENEM